jgi:hypothetical protein
MDGSFDPRLNLRLQQLSISMGMVEISAILLGWEGIYRRAVSTCCYLIIEVTVGVTEK